MKVSELVKTLQELNQGLDVIFADENRNVRIEGADEMYWVGDDLMHKEEIALMDIDEDDVDDEPVVALVGW